MVTTLGQMTPSTRGKRGSALSPAPPDLADEALRLASLPGDLSGAELAERRFEGGGAPGRDATAVEVAECSLVDVDLSHAVLRRAYVRDTRIQGGSWANVDATESVLRRIEIRDVRFTGATLVRARLEDVTFVGCRIDFASFRFTELQRVRFEGCRLEEADLYHARASDVVFATCSLSRASLAEAVFERSEMRDCDLSGLGNAERLRGMAMPWTDVLRNAATLAEGIGVRILDDG
jgi:uncharacterized protein YjbI with pentapeptide repeats